MADPTSFDCRTVAADLDPAQTYTVQVSKRTEPQMRGAMSTFKVRACEIPEWQSETGHLQGTTMRSR